MASPETNRSDTPKPPLKLRSGSVFARPNAVCLLVHGGAWDIPQKESSAHLDGLQQAIERGQALLLAGTPAIDVVAETVSVLESHGAFDAGCGAVLTREGTVELDAGLMDGATLAFGAVAGVHRLANPIAVARKLLTKGQGEVRLMVGEGAERFAETEGFALVDNATLICERERLRYLEHLQKAATYHTSHPFLATPASAPRGTVGCVARDQKGHLAAATSTGGTPFRPSGRVGDSPLPGSGFYANRQAAAGATGWGEAIATMLLCGRSVDMIAAGRDPEATARGQLRTLFETVTNQEGHGATAGLLLLDQHGRGAWAYTTPRMARGAWHDGGPVWVDV